MNTILVLILFPFIVAMLTFLIRHDGVRNWIVRLGAVITVVLTVFAGFQYYVNGALTPFSMNEKIIDYFIVAIEIIIVVYIFITGIVSKKYIVSLFAIIQTPLLLWFEFTQKSGVEEIKANMLIDNLTVIMLLIVGVIGGLICLYSAGYMKWYHVHHAEYKERKSIFFAIIFLFLSAMFGLVLSNNIMWIYFCWEITTLCSFWLIGYTKTKEARNNAFKALAINLAGGVAFAIGIVLMGMNLHTLELSALVQMKPGIAVLVPVFLLSFAGLTKSAQFPFSSWLLGAMVAPTPTSALLHSATMVKAGVYLIIRLAPLLGTTSVGIIMTLIGSLTFLIASLKAIPQNDAKKILAYSTIANLGLIITCASIGTQKTLWAAILLVIFHAVCKSLLFLTVGAAEHQLGSRNVENMEVLMHLSTKISIFMVIGIAGMFLAPFGMLISKWVAMKGFVDADNIFTVIIIVFGSATTLFYWTKWMGKILSGAHLQKKDKHKFHKDEYITIFVQGIIVIIACLAFPAISKYTITPYLAGLFGTESVMPIGAADIYIMIFMLAILLIFPVTYYLISKSDKTKKASVYMAGINMGDDESFVGTMGAPRKVELRNWYMDDYFGGKKITFWGNILCIAILCAGVLLLIGGIA